MSAVQKYQDRVVAAMGTKDSKVASFDFSLIITLLPMLLDIISGCSKKKSTEQLADDLVGRGIMVKVAAQHAVNKMCRECDCKLRSSEKIRLAEATLSAVGTKDDAVELLEEIGDSDNGWDMLA